MSFAIEVEWDLSDVGYCAWYLLTGADMYVVAACVGLRFKRKLRA